MINFIQHVAFGVADVDRSYRFYRDVLGFRIKFIDVASIKIHEMPLSQDFIDPDIKQDMRILFAFHPKGGSGVELVRFNDAESRPPVRVTRPGDLGFFEIGMRVNRLDEYVELIRSRGERVSDVVTEPADITTPAQNYAYMRDPDGTLIRLIETGSRPPKGKPSTAGIEYIGIGVSDLNACEKFYTDALGLGITLNRWSESVPAIDHITHDVIRSENSLVGNVRDRKGQVRIVNQSRIKLVQAEGNVGSDTLKGRRWGDVGVMELALDTSKLDKVTGDLREKGAETILLTARVKLGPGTYGYVAFAKDPDGNLIELVEIRKIFFLPSRIPSAIQYPLVNFLDSIRKAEIDLTEIFTLEM